MRSYLDDKSMDAIRKSNLNFYAGLYPKIETIDSPSFRDDRVRNVLIEDESYYIQEFWKPTEEKEKRISATFTSQYTRDLVQMPGTKVRTMPFALGYPRKLVHTIEINLPWESEWEKEDVVVEDPAFRFEYSAVPSGAKLTLRHGYAALADHVPAAAISQYIENIQRMRRFLAYRITLPSEWATPGSAVTPEVASATAAPQKADKAPVDTADSATRAGKVVGVTLLIGVVVGGVFLWLARGRRTAEDHAPVLHRCVICGETEKSDPSLEFRVASNGADYCRRHLPASLRSLPPPLPPR